MSDDLTGLPQYSLTMEALERSKHLSAQGTEFWFAREVFPILGYAEWRNFEDVMGRAKEAMTANGIEPSHHFVGTTRMVGLGSGSQRRVDDFFLSRPACYLTA
jgi:DNA-damage-inducible protein D